MCHAICVRTKGQKLTRVHATRFMYVRCGRSLKSTLNGRKNIDPSTTADSDANDTRVTAYDNHDPRLATQETKSLVTPVSWHHTSTYLRWVASNTGLTTRFYPAGVVELVNVHQHNSKTVAFFPRLRSCFL